MSDRKMQNNIHENRLTPGPASKAVKSSTSWGDIFSDALWRGEDRDTPWAGGPGGFVLSYRLELGKRQTRLSAMERYIRKDGGLGRIRHVSAATMEHRGLPVEDRIIMAMLEGIVLARPFSLHGASGRYSPRGLPGDLMGIPLEGRDAEALLPILARTGRCLAVHNELGVLGDPLTAGASFEANLRIEAEESGRAGFYEVSTFIQFGDKETARLDAIPHIFNTSPVYFIWQRHLHMLKGPSYSALMAMMHAKARVSRKELKGLIIKASSFDNGPSLIVPKGLEPEYVKIEPVPNLMLEIKDGALSARLTMDYGGIEVDLKDKRQVILDATGWRRIGRSYEAEASRRVELKDHGFEETGEGTFARPVSGAAGVISDLAVRGWSIYGSGKRPVKGGSIAGLRVSSGMDWFDLDGDVSFGPGLSVPLSRALKSALKGERLIRLGDGTIGLLPDEWIMKHLPALELAAGGRNRKRLRFRLSQAMLLDSLLEGKTAEFDDGRFQELTSLLKAFSGIKKAPVPPLFKGRLRVYQKEALGWFAFLKQFGFGGILADDMGLGKTVEVLAMLAGEDRGGGPSLIVAPTSLVFNWQREAGRFIPDLKVFLYCGAGRSCSADGFKDADIIVTTYAILRRDIAFLSEQSFNCIILDESQAIKNAASMTARAVRLLKGARRLCLTGTPLENHVGELWPQMEFLNPGILGSLGVFDAKFARPIANGDEDTLNLLKKIVRPFILRRTKEAVAKDLPDKVEYLVRCRMTEGQARFYEKVRDHYRASVMVETASGSSNNVRFRILEGLLRLRQAAAHPGLLGEEGAGSGKLDELMSLVEKVVSEGHKALIFSQFTSMLAFVRDAVSQMGIDYEYLDGKTPGFEREERVRRFQVNEGVRLFLISLKAGGVGLNLTAADYVFLVDPWWNPAVELQAIDRTHRIGQGKKVFTYRLISEGTVEEKVMALQDRKRKLVGEFLSGHQDMLKKLSRDDIAFLFS
jgi:superfamily II DNA or RNA helicase